MKESLISVQKAVNELMFDEIKGLVFACLDEGIPPLEIIEAGISKGLELVGEQFETGTYFLADLVMAGEVVKEAMPILEEKMDPGAAGQKGKIVLATVEGDIHEIGKNIVGMLLNVNGYEVIDLGVDVSAGKILAAVKETGARLIGLSALLSTMIGGIKEVVDSVVEAGLKDHVKVVIGGACTSEQLKEEMGADGYGETAVQAVKIFDKLSAT
ncbi:MAG: cobalamin-binding protein [Desulfobacteraceae bacterium]|nr:cobalamin B12-binding domain-containing protein [Desulfobacteraceae bacterium]MBC2755658.1 cobalamin-binding protein [Desulfobacteraceae bacterium]